jgi:hypothetical protein
MSENASGLAPGKDFAAKQAAQQTGTQQIGYIGCSNTMASVVGYHSIAGNLNRFWPAYMTGGGSIEQWAQSSSSYWNAYETELATYGQPALVWVQLCENYLARPTTYTSVQSALAILKQLSPRTTIYISAINVYNPLTLCRLMGTNGQGETDTNSWRDRAVAADLARLGPEMGPLTAQILIYDQCHPNSVGMTLLGNQLKTFFDTK